MKNHDLSVLKSNFPKIPTITFLIEKNGELFEFKTWKELSSWVEECLSKELDNAYFWENQDGARFNGIEEMLDNWMTDDMDQFLWSCGWRFTRVVK